MAETMQFDLVSPERRLASFAALEVQIPGADGDLTAMPDHAPLITTLRPGILRVKTATETAAYAVTGGFAEITAAATSVLAEAALPLSEVTRRARRRRRRARHEGRGRQDAGRHDRAARGRGRLSARPSGGACAPERAPAHPGARSIFRPYFRHDWPVV
jgi:F-type H+-transporting ATPase subunit epsilon